MTYSVKWCWRRQLGLILLKLAGHLYHRELCSVVLRNGLWPLWHEAIFYTSVGFEVIVFEFTSILIPGEMTLSIITYPRWWTFFEVCSYGYKQLTSHYPNECWPNPMTHICVTRGQWVNAHPELKRGCLIYWILFVRATRDSDFIFRWNCFVQTPCFGVMFGWRLVYQQYKVRSIWIANSWHICKVM